MRRFLVPAAVVVMIAAPRVARADLWVNIDTRLVFYREAPGCSYQRTTSKYKVYKCPPTKGNGMILMRKTQLGAYEITAPKCTLSFWGSGPTNDTFHMNLKNDAGMTCTASWDNNNTITVKLDEK